MYRDHISLTLTDSGRYRPYRCVIWLKWGCGLQGLKVEWAQRVWGRKLPRGFYGAEPDEGFGVKPLETDLNNLWRTNASNPNRLPPNFL